MEKPSENQCSFLEMTVTRGVPAGPFTEDTSYTKAAACEVAEERLYIKLVRVEKTPQSSTLQE